MKGNFVIIRHVERVCSPNTDEAGVGSESEGYDLTHCIS